MPERNIVIFREPRDVVLSGYKYRIEVMHQQWVEELSVKEYIYKRFEVSTKHAETCGDEVMSSNAIKAFAISRSLQNKHCVSFRNAQQCGHAITGSWHIP